MVGYGNVSQSCEIKELKNYWKMIRNGKLLANLLIMGVERAEKSSDTVKTASRTSAYFWSRNATTKKTYFQISKWQNPKFRSPPGLTRGERMMWMIAKRLGIEDDVRTVMD